jgi:methyltransferase (TIGR00027 family)
MDPIAKTAWYCCGVRAADARRRWPICGDHLAERFMDAEGQAVFARFESFSVPNSGNAARHRIVDDLLRQQLTAKPDMSIVLLGAGFDTRAYRLTGGRWFELDQAAIVERKEALLPASGAPNPLVRIAIDFAHDKLADRLQACGSCVAPIVVMEGVSMYLNSDELRATLQTLHSSLPGHTLVCDLMRRAFTVRASPRFRQRLGELGARFTPPLEEPADFVAANGYQLLSHHSIFGRAVAHFRLPGIGWLFNLLQRRVRDGYQIYVFKALSAPGR